MLDVPVRAGTAVTIRFIHSVQKTPVWEYLSVNDRADGWEQLYRTGITWALGHRWTVLFAGAGSLVLVPAGCVHACNPLPDTLWSYQMLHLDARWLQAHAPALDGDTATVLHCPLLYAQFCAMNALLFSKAGAAEKDAALLAFLGACASARADPLPSERKPLPRQLAPVLATLQARPSASLPQLAQAADLSPYQLIRAFRAATGMTPHAYQLNLSVNRARHRLHAGVALADIACELGFADQSHLQRVFKAHAGITPGRYRRQGG